MTPSSPNLHPAPPANTPLTVALIGVGGYGQMYARPLLEEARARGIHFAAAVDNNPTSLPCEALRAGGVPIYPTQDELYAKHHIDLTIIVSPIHFHHRQTLRALAAGSHVLVEKPVAATYDQALEMLAAQKAANKVVAVGFQWSFCPVINALKADIAAGKLGAPKRLRSLVIWPRDRIYYTRNNWAGREFVEMSDASTGVVKGGVFDSPANNAAAHFLHNMLFVLGDKPNRSAGVKNVSAELFRANPIESYDTASIRVTTTTGTPIHFLTSHAATRHIGPINIYEFEDATITHTEESPFTATFTRGSAAGQTKTYGRPVHANTMEKLWSVAQAIREGNPNAISCDIETCLPHAKVISLARELSPIHPIHPHHIDRTATQIRVPGIEEIFESAFESGDRLADLGFNTPAIPHSTKPALAVR